MIQYAVAFSLTVLLSLLLTPLVRNFALKIKALDRPGEKRRIHTKPIPRIGGLAIVAVFLIGFAVFFVDFGAPFLGVTRQFAGMLGGLLIVFLVGLVDDLRGLGHKQKLFWQIIAAGVVLAGGIGIVYISNPLGGTLALDGWRIPVDLGPLHFNILPIANLVSIIWMVGMINTINFLDGLDGLATGVTSFALLVLFVMAVSFNPIVSLLSILLLGALVGFLPYNFFPARIFLGDGGAYSIGLLLATLSIYTDSKVAVGSLVLSLAIVDTVWAVIRRLMKGRSPFAADREHLHHTLLDLGFEHRQAVLILYFAAAVLAATVLYLGALAAFVALVAMLGGFGVLSRFLPSRSKL